MILISLHVMYIILSPWIEIRPLSLTSNPPLQMFKKLHLTPPPTLRFGLSSGPPINLRNPPPLQIIIAQSLKQRKTSK